VDREKQKGGQRKLKKERREGLVDREKRYCDKT
jgi:hypothetical protein